MIARCDMFSPVQSHSEDISEAAGIYDHRPSMFTPVKMALGANTRSPDISREDDDYFPAVFTPQSSIPTCSQNVSDNDEPTVCAMLRLSSPLGPSNAVKIILSVDPWCYWTGDAGKRGRQKGIAERCR
jgi:hypothetical protein